MTKLTWRNFPRWSELTSLIFTLIGEWRDPYPDRQTDKYSSKECQGFPSNCYFQKGAINFEIPWGMGPDHWSFIRGGLLCGTVTDWSAFYEKIR